MYPATSATCGVSSNPFSISFLPNVRRSTHFLKVNTPSSSTKIDSVTPLFFLSSFLSIDLASPVAATKILNAVLKGLRSKYVGLSPPSALAPFFLSNFFF